MGIRLLNTFLQTHTTGITKKIHLRSLRGKRVVVDASIYMYRFNAVNNLIENMYMLCSLFRYYGIHPLFVFDGEKRRKDKNKTLLRRRAQKVAAKNKYSQYERELNNLTEELERERLTSKMEELRRSFVTITKSDLEKVKKLLDAYGIMYRTATAEADEFCAAMVIKGIAYACLSEDTDMFAFGCPRVLKYISLINHTTVMYNLSDILNNLNLTLENFQTICLLSGTDYIDANVGGNIFNNYDLYKTFSRNHTGAFIDWMLDNKYLTYKKYKILQNEQKHYDKSIDDVYSDTNYFRIRNREVDRDDLHRVLKTDGFVFPK